MNSTTHTHTEVDNALTQTTITTYVDSPLAWEANQSTTYYLSS